MVIPKNNNLSVCGFINKFAHCPCYLVMNMIVLTACYYCSAVRFQADPIICITRQSLENYAIDHSIHIYI